MFTDWSYMLDVQILFVLAAPVFALFYFGTGQHKK